MAVNVGIGYDSHRFAEDRPLVLGESRSSTSGDSPATPTPML